MFITKIFRPWMESIEQSETKPLCPPENKISHSQPTRNMGGCLSVFSRNPQHSHGDGGEATSTERLLSDTERNQPARYRTMDESSNEYDLENEIHEGLNELIKESTNRCASAVILPAEVRSFWDNLHRSSFYTEQSWYDRKWSKSNLMSDYRIIMSILIKIGFKRWKEFRSIFIDKANRKDENLPFSKDAVQSVDFLGFSGREFYVAQWVFCPLVIVENSDPLELKGEEEERRFPFIEHEKEIGSGAAGTVYKQVIAAGHIEYQSPGRESTNKQVSKGFHHNV